MFRNHPREVAPEFVKLRRIGFEIVQAKRAISKIVDLMKTSSGGCHGKPGAPPLVGVARVLLDSKEARYSILRPSWTRRQSFAYDKDLVRDLVRDLVNDAIVVLTPIASTNRSIAAMSRPVPDQLPRAFHSNGKSATDHHGLFAVTDIDIHCGA
jgi:hypothetical protein